MNGHVLCLAEILIAIVDSSARQHAAACSESLMVGFTKDRSVSCCPCKTIDQQMYVTHRMDALYTTMDKTPLLLVMYCIYINTD